MEIEEEIDIDGPTPNKVKDCNGVTKYYSVKSKEYLAVANYLFSICGHAYRDGIEEYVLKCILTDTMTEPKTWHVLLTQGDANSHTALYLKMVREWASLHEARFKEGKIHDHVREMMEQYRKKPKKDQEELICLSSPGFYTSPTLGGRCYILDEKTKLPVDKGVNRELLGRTQVIWTGPDSTKRTISNQDKIEPTVTKLFDLMRSSQRGNFASSLALLGMSTVSMNKRVLPSTVKVGTAHLIGPAGSGND
jgi:hypothetical protein